MDQYQNEREKEGGKGSGQRERDYSSLGEKLQDVLWANETLPKISKDFYSENAHVSNRTDEEIDEFRKSNDITIKGKNIPRPVQDFREAGFPDYLVFEMLAAGFKAPLPIQAQGWPTALSGRDMVGVAQTGSGKTLAYLLPSIVHLNAQPTLGPGDGPIVLVLLPTRELAQQVQSEAEKFGKSSKVKFTCVYGGCPKRAQEVKLREGVEICIATPGRLIDFLESGVTNLKRVTYLVLDEADKLLDSGFDRHVRQIISQVRPDRQTLMYSATFSQDVQAIFDEMTKDNVRIVVGSEDTNANRNIKQIIKLVNENDKMNALMQCIEQDAKSEPQSKILVFCHTKAMAEQLLEDIGAAGVPCKSLHGDKTQTERDLALQSFRDGKIQVLIASDIASRGLDINDITIVFNYDFPKKMEDYVHRIGRTGRAGKKGKAVSLITEKAAGGLSELVKIMRDANQDISKELDDFESKGDFVAETFDGMNYTTTRRNKAPRNGDDGEGKRGGFGGQPCFKCGETGHKKSECTMADDRGGSGGGSGGSCFSCGQEGHRKADCPSGSRSGGGGRGCFNCGEEGHKKADCQNPPKNDFESRPKGKCYHCGEQDHRASNCPTKDSSGGWGRGSGGDDFGSRGDDFGRSRGSGRGGGRGGFSRGDDFGHSRGSGRGGGGKGGGECFTCGEEGHKKADCPKKGSSGRGGGNGECYSCGQMGHRSFECPSKSEDKSGGFSGRRQGNSDCFKCGKPGHRAAECSQNDRESFADFDRPSFRSSNNSGARRHSDADYNADNGPPQLDRAGRSPTARNADYSPSP